MLNKIRIKLFICKNIFSLLLISIRFILFFISDLYNITTTTIEKESGAVILKKEFYTPIMFFLILNFTTRITYNSLKSSEVYFSFAKSFVVVLIACFMYVGENKLIMFEFLQMLDIITHLCTKKKTDKVGDNQNKKF